MNVSYKKIIDKQLLYVHRHFDDTVLTPVDGVEIRIRIDGLQEDDEASWDFRFEKEPDPEFCFTWMVYHNDGVISEGDITFPLGLYDPYTTSVNDDSYPRLWNEPGDKIIESWENGDELVFSFEVLSCEQDTDSDWR